MSSRQKGGEQAPGGNMAVRTGSKSQRGLAVLRCYNNQSNVVGQAMASSA